jgi:hypothetical protein
MKPSDKNPKIDAMLTAVFGVDRQAAIIMDECVSPPIGCGKPIENFALWSEIEQGEYRISGLCQACQRKVFKANYE